METMGALSSQPHDANWQFAMVSYAVGNRLFVIWKKLRTIQKTPIQTKQMLMISGKNNAHCAL